MKRKILLVLILACVSVPSQAQFWKKALNAVKNFAGAVVVGAVDAVVESSGDANLKNNWKTLKEDSNIMPSYGSDAGNAAMRGDWISAGIAAASAVAEEAGVSPDLVALGNSGVTNWVNGDKKSAIIDATQVFTHATGHYEFDFYIDSQREFNKIGQEHRDNIRNGMSKEEADRIRIDKIANVSADIMMYIEEQVEERRARVLSRRREAQDALLQRGYSKSEADYLSLYFAVEDIENDEEWQTNINDELDAHNIDSKEPVKGDSFFDETSVVDADSNIANNEPDVPIVEAPKEPSPEEIYAKEKTIAIEKINETVLNDYVCGNTNLSESQKIELDSVVEMLNHYQDIYVTIIGHTCNIGSYEINQKVGEFRAKNAKKYLIKKGISDERVEIESQGFSIPVIDNDTEEHRKKNRRISFVAK